MIPDERKTGGLYLEERCKHVPHGGGGISSLKQADTSVKLQVPDQYILFKQMSNNWKPLKSKECLGLSLISLIIADNRLNECWQLD